MAIGRRPSPQRRRRVGGGRVRLRRIHGDRVAAGEVIAELHTDDPSLLPAAHEALSGALTLAETAPEPRRLIAARNCVAFS